MNRHAVIEMPKKRERTVALTKQIALRLPQAIVERIDEAAALLGLDTSNFMRMLIIEKLPEYEDRAQRSRKAE